MAKQPEDKKTAELLPVELAPVPAKRGRKPKGDKPMSDAQRKAKSRLLNMAKQVEFNQVELLALWHAVNDAQENRAELALEPLESLAGIKRKLESRLEKHPIPF